MDRKLLFEQALKETGSLVQAVELVKQIESFIGSIPTVIDIPLRKPAPESVQGFPTFTKKPHATGFKCKRWTEEDKRMATAMFEAGRSVEEVAEAARRSVKGIRNALSNKTITPIRDPRSKARRIGTLKGHITSGRKLHDYPEAEMLLDSANKKD